MRLLKLVDGCCWARLNNTRRSHHRFRLFLAKARNSDGKQETQNGQKLKDRRAGHDAASVKWNSDLHFARAKHAQFLAGRNVPPDPFAEATLKASAAEKALSEVPQHVAAIQRH